MSSINYFMEQLVVSIEYLSRIVTHNMSTCFYNYFELIDMQFESLIGIRMRKLEKKDLAC